MKTTPFCLSLFVFALSGILFCNAQTQPWLAPQDFISKQNPVAANDASIEEGKNIYSTFCISCHGEKGKGNGELAINLFPKPADHTSPQFQQQTDGEIFYKISTGRNAMPTFQSYADEDIWNIVNFIRTLKDDKNTATPLKENETVQTSNLISEKKQTDEVQNERKKFLLTGSAQTKIVAESEFHSTGFQIGWMPLFLWKPTKRLFFESHLHIEAGVAGSHSEESEATSGTSGGHGHGSSASSSAAGSSASIMIDYANLVYFLHPNITVTGGLFLSPFGIFAERLHPEWINKLPDAPLGVGHDNQLLPGTELGFQMKGGIPFGKFKINYALYVSNGAALIDTGENAGQLSYENLSDNNSNKAIGGRIGLIPIPSLEIGFSAQKAKVGNENTSYEGVDALLWAADISFHKYFKIIKGTIDFKGQYNMVAVDKIYYPSDPLLTVNVPAEDVNLADSTYRFNNSTEIYFATIAYRPTALQNFLKNTEYIFRYDVLNTPSFALWNESKTRWTVGIAYWLESRSAVKLSFQSNILPSMGGHGHGGNFENYLMAQWVIGL